MEVETYVGLELIAKVPMDWNLLLSCRFAYRILFRHSHHHNVRVHHTNKSCAYIHQSHSVAHTNHILLKQQFNPFKPSFTIAIFIHNKPRIAVAILDL